MNEISAIRLQCFPNTLMMKTSPGTRCSGFYPLFQPHWAPSTWSLLHSELLPASGPLHIRCPLELFYPHTLPLPYSSTLGLSLQIADAQSKSGLPGPVAQGSPPSAFRALLMVCNQKGLVSICPGL